MDKSKMDIKFEADMKELSSSFLITEEDASGFEDETFSFTSRASKFDEHIDNSIRGYSFLRKDVAAMSRYFVENDTNVIDIGCSQGTLIRSIREINTQAPTAAYYGIDVNPAFQQHWKDEENLHYFISDITKDEFRWGNLSLAISLFTFQFIPERHRLNLMKTIYDNLIEGGAFIFSEKVFSINAKIQNMMEFMYYDYKKEHFTEKQILDKEEELRHLAKLTNENLLSQQLRSIGFRGIQSFWRNYNFVGYIALKLPKNKFEEE